MGLTSNIKDKDWVSVRQGIAKMGSTKLGPTSTPTYAGLTLTGLTVNSLVYPVVADDGTSTGALTSLGAATDGELPIGDTGGIPILATLTGVANEIDITNAAGSITIGLVNPLIVAKGGSGAASFTDHSILLGSDTQPFTALGLAANGQIPIGFQNSDPVLANITGTAKQVIVTNGAGTIALSGPQDIDTVDSPEFADVVLGDWQLGTPTYDSVHDWMNTTQSAGRISGGGFTDNGDGTLTVAAGTGIIKTTDSRTGTTLMFDWAEDADVQTDAEPPVALTDGAVNYIYVDYNDGTPAVYSTTTAADITRTDRISLGRVYREGTTLHLLAGGAPTNDPTRRTHEAIKKTLGFHRTSGLATSEVGDLGIAITQGVLWYGLRDYALFTGTNYSSVDTNFRLWYNDAGGWQDNATGVLTHNYNNYGTGLVATTAQQYGVFWVYLHVDGDVHVVYGLDSYKLAAAENVPTPVNLPPMLVNFSILIAKIILKTEETTTFTQVNTPWEYTISGGIATNHDSLGNLSFATAGHTGFQAQSDALDSIAALGAIADNEFLVGTGAGTYAYEDAATAAISMGLGELTAWLDDVTLEDGGAITTTQVATFAQLVLTPRAAALSAVEGAMFYDSDDNNVYVCTEGA